MGRLATHNGKTTKVIFNQPQESHRPEAIQEVVRAMTRRDTQQ
jgi:hypothetical protein